MFSLKNPTQKNTNQRASVAKGANRFLLPVICFVFLGVLFGSESIRAQIEGLYDEKNDQVAGINALMLAVSNNDVNGVKFFSKAGRALVNQKNFGGATALHLSCREKNFEITKILIESGADVNVIDNEGWTPLMRATLSGNKNIVSLLLSKDAQASNVNLIGESAIIHAALADCSECLDVMFEKFNFIKLMDIRLLKAQLTDAFIISRNRDNQAAQGLIEAYLDKAIKMSPLMEKEKNEVSAKKESVAANQVVDKVFKITSSETETVNQSEKAPVPMIAKQDDKRSLVQNISLAPAEKPSEQVIAKISKAAPPAAPAVVIVKKFRFISGPQGKEIKAETSQKQNFKFSGNCKCDESESPKRAFPSSKKNDQEVIFLIRKSSNPKVETQTIVGQKTDKTVFKFQKGPAGKVVKKIIKRGSKSNPAVIEEEAATKPVEQKIEQKQPALVEKKIPKKDVLAEQNIAKPQAATAVAAEPKKLNAAVPTGKIPTTEKKLSIPSQVTPMQQPAISKPLTAIPQSIDEIEKSVIIDLSKPIKK